MDNDLVLVAAIESLIVVFQTPGRCKVNLTSKVIQSTALKDLESNTGMLKDRPEHNHPKKA